MVFVRFSIIFSHFFFFIFVRVCYPSGVLQCPKFGYLFAWWKISEQTIHQQHFFCHKFTRIVQPPFALFQTHRMCVSMCMYVYSSIHFNAWHCNALAHSIHFPLVFYVFDTCDVCALNAIELVKGKTKKRRKIYNSLENGKIFAHLFRKNVQITRKKALFLHTLLEVATHTHTHIHRL